MILSRREILMRCFGICLLMAFCALPFSRLEAAGKPGAAVSQNLTGPVYGNLGKDLTALDCGDFGQMIASSDEGKLRLIAVWMNGIIAGANAGVSANPSGYSKKPAPLSDGFAQTTLRHLATQCEVRPQTKLWDAYLSTTADEKFGTLDGKKFSKNGLVSKISKYSPERMTCAQWNESLTGKATNDLTLVLVWLHGLHTGVAVSKRSNAAAKPRRLDPFNQAFVTKATAALNTNCAEIPYMPVWHTYLLSAED